MLYQLPNGKVVYLSLDEYLSLDRQGIQDLIAMNVGNVPTSNWYGSVIKHSDRDNQDDEEEEEEVDDGTIEMRSFEELDDECSDIDINNIPDEE